MAETEWDDKTRDNKWVEIQKKTFTRWANTYLKERMLKCEDLETGFHDGILLINLLEIISSKSLGRFNKNPKIRSQLLENTNLCLNFLKSEGIKLVNIGGEDIVDGKLKLILGLIWTIICRYQIHIEEGKSARSDLLKWVRSKIPEYNIMNFSHDWNDGKAICALCDALMAGICPNHRELDANQPLYNARLGTETAESKLDIPPILAPEDMISPAVDELSVMTYISYFRDWEANQAKKKSAEEIERTSVPAKCRAYGPGLEKGETQIPTEFTIEAINANGRRVPHGSDPFSVNIKGPKSDVNYEFEDQGNGLYTVKYTPTDIGRHTITVTLHNQNIMGSPFGVPVTRSPPDASKVKVYGPGVEPGNTAGQGTQFTIQACNKLGEPLKDGGDKFDVKINAPYDTELLPEIKDNKDGTYTVLYKPVDHGDHAINISVNGTPLPQCPIHVKVDRSSEDADATQCVAYGPGLEGGSTSEPSNFTIEARNSQGQKITATNVPIDAEVYDSEHNEVPVKITRNEDGTFNVSYQPVEPGKYQVHVLLRHKLYPLYYEHIQKSPFRLEVEAGTDANKTIAFGPGLEDNKVTDQLPTHFTIQSKDRNGNDMKKGGDPFEVTVQGPNGPVPATVKDNGDGTYHVDYAPTDAGKHKIEVKLKGQNVAKAPYTINVKEGADNETSVIEGFSFVIQAKTKKGQNKKEGGDKFEVKIEGDAEVPVHVQDVGNGTYVVTYKLTVAGKYVIRVLLNGTPLKGYENGINVSY